MITKYNKRSVIQLENKNKRVPMIMVKMVIDHTLMIDAMNIYYITLLTTVI